LAEDLTYLGVNGHLATITSQSEQDFIHMLEPPGEQIRRSMEIAAGSALSRKRMENRLNGSQASLSFTKTGESANLGETISTTTLN
jgi:hypothetical protein